MASSEALYNTFGNEVNYRFLGGVLQRYLQDATIQFPLPDAGSEILANLLSDRIEIRDYVKFDMVRIRLEKAGYKPANARAFAPIIVRVAEIQGVDPLDFFEANSNSLQFTIDAYNAINAQRPKGSRVGMATQPINSDSRANKLIKP